MLIPAGTKVFGEADKVNSFGQQHLAVFFHRLIMPDGYSVNLDQFKGLDQLGATALHDKVNNHYAKIFGASLAVGILGGIGQAGTGPILTQSALDQARVGFGESMAMTGERIMDRFLNLMPTITIREGTRVKVYLSNDLLLPDYNQHTMPSDFWGGNDHEFHTHARNRNSLGNARGMPLKKAATGKRIYPPRLLPDSCRGAGFREQSQCRPRQDEGRKRGPGRSAKCPFLWHVQGCHTRNSDGKEFWGARLDTTGCSNKPTFPRFSTPQTGGKKP